MSGEELHIENGYMVSTRADGAEHVGGPLDGTGHFTQETGRALDPDTLAALERAGVSVSLSVTNREGGHHGNTMSGGQAPEASADNPSIV